MNAPPAVEEMRVGVKCGSTALNDTVWRRSITSCGTIDSTKSDRSALTLNGGIAMASDALTDGTTKPIRSVVALNVIE